MAEPQPPTAPITALAWRLGFLYAALFLVVGCYLPYIPVWLRYRALDADAIAFLLATPLFVRIVFTPLISILADHVADRRTVLIVLAWGSLFSFMLLWAAPGFWQMFAAMVLLAINWTTIMPLIETVAVSGMRKAGLDYGRVRLWGSVSFIVASLGTGVVIDRFGGSSVLPLLLATVAGLVFATHLVPRNLAAAAGASPRRRRIRLADAAALLRAPVFLLFIAAASLISASHAIYYAFGTLHWRAQGFPAGAIGVLWSIGVVAEIGLFVFSGRIIRVTGAAKLLMLAGLGACLRWLFMALDPPLLATVALQCLHALSFGAAHVAAIHFLAHAVPEDRAATAQGLYAATVAGLVLGVVTLASGPLYRILGGEAYAVMAALALCGTAGAVLLMRRWRAGSLVAPMIP
ncbi:MAG: MFS transporter [Planctomycetes bacterium]|nr:MFS transporter [Planctomycetota bacterium]